MRTATKLALGLLRGRGGGGDGPSDLYTYLVSWWACEEDGGTRADSHGTNHLTTPGTVARTEGRVGYGARPSHGGGMSYLSVASNAALQPGAGLWALCGWMVDEGGGGNRILCGKADEWQLQKTNASTHKFFFGDAIVTSTTWTTTGGWRFVCLWSDGAFIYISVDNQAVPDSAPLTTPPAATANPLGFGYGALGMGNLCIDEIAIWKDYAPSAAERAWLYNAGVGRSYANLVAAYG